MQTKNTAKKIGPKVAKKAEIKAAEKKEVQTKAKVAKAKPEKKKKEISKEILKVQKKIKAKKHVLFRGRFGKRRIRRISNKKWQRWRVPRGIDIEMKQHDGYRPKIGYRFAKGIRHLHPSGYPEKTVFNVEELMAISNEKKPYVIRVAGKVGKRKRIDIVKKANELGLRILNYRY
ncbi:MAG: hypothetical protein COT15_04115 [Candidatus Diapherotrites archaeon CG08_land_8_20_14_0_20_34_12]|nr:MAG: hypothetical protein COT15_04115 [Candidatus Diapherotrites archaeon CG08_land_8_20_14_0_20_34_12]